jgi:hypothetical protein
MSILCIKNSTRTLSEPKYCLHTLSIFLDFLTSFVISPIHTKGFLEDGLLEAVEHAGAEIFPVRFAL